MIDIQTFHLELIDQIADDMGYDVMRYQLSADSGTLWFTPQRKWGDNASEHVAPPDAWLMYDFSSDGVRVETQSRNEANRQPNSALALQYAEGVQKLVERITMLLSGNRLAAVPNDKPKRRRRTQGATA
jgi:hypothetical protein